jgi:hypothetical protein
VRYDLVKEALRDVVLDAAIPELDAYSFAPDEPCVPCFYLAEVVIDPNGSFGPDDGGFDKADITGRILASANDDADGQRRLDRLLSRSGTYSIRAALLAGRGVPGVAAIPGQADDFWVTRVDGYRMVPGPNETRWYGANLTIRVIGS